MPETERKEVVKPMGMFDFIRCKYPLPNPGANLLDYQTKDTPNQFLDNYEIRENGTLWVEEYDIEDRSDSANWKRANPGLDPPKELDEFLGCMSRHNKRWVSVLDFTGEIRFYCWESPVMHEWSSYFVKGMITQIHKIERPLKP